MIISTYLIMRGMTKIPVSGEVHLVGAQNKTLISDSGLQ